MAELSRQAFESLEKQHGLTDSTTLLALPEYVGVLHGVRQYETSDALLKKALEDSNSVLGPQHRCTLQILSCHGYMSYLLGDLKEADGLLSQASSGFKKTSGVDHFDTIICMSRIAECKEAQGSYDEAIEHSRSVLDGSARTRGLGHPFSVYYASKVADLRSLLLERAVFHEALEQVNARFEECLRDSLIHVPINRRVVLVSCCISDHA